MSYMYVMDSTLFAIVRLVQEQTLLKEQH